MNEICAKCILQSREKSSIILEYIGVLYDFATFCTPLSSSASDMKSVFGE